MIFDFTSLPQSKNVFLKKCVCVCARASVCPSRVVEPKPIDRSRSNSISRVPLQISLAHFFVFDLPSKLRVVDISKKIKILISSKLA